MTSTRPPRRKPRPRPTTRAELLAREEADWKELTATWRGLPEAAFDQPGANGRDWTVKDVMNHVAAWMEAALRIMPELAAGRKATLGHGTDRFNAIHYAADRDRSLAATRRRLNRRRRELLALIETMPDKPLLDQSTRLNWWFRYTMYAHYSEHIGNLSAFRRRVLGSSS